MVNRNYLVRWLFAIAAGCLIGPSAFAAPPSRITENLGSGRTFQLEGNTHPLVATLPDKGSAPPDTPLPRITIDFNMSAAQQAALSKLLADQQNPSSPRYHQWLTPEQFGEQFGMSASDLSKVTNWARSLGFTNIQVARSKNSVSMAGTAALAEYAFQTAIHNFDRNGTIHFANIADPMLPAGLRGVVSSVRGLSNLRPKPRVKVKPHLSEGSSGNFIAPGDFATIYDLQPLYNSGIDGTGQKIAIVGQTDIQTFDIEAFQSAAGLTVKAPTIVLAGTDPGLVKDDLSEAELDVEWAAAVAPGATIVYVNSQDAFTSLTYAIQNKVANVLSVTYGNCESQFGTSSIKTYEGYFQQANSQGMTLVAASGDSGAADCDGSTDPNKLDTSATQGLAVDYPASSVYVTGAGGTTFNEGGGNYWALSNSADGSSALSYIPEMAWNDDCSPGATSAADCSATATYGLSASGGGVSTVNPKPSWQAATGVPADGARDVPDISLAASPNHDGYVVCETPPTHGVPATTSSCVNGFASSTQTLNIVGGTSVSAPAFAGMIALINQMTSGAQGNVNPRLYVLASAAPDVFHDITLGNNIVPCTAGSTDCSNGILGYNTAAGYDLVTGLGSVDGNNLVQSFAPSYTLSVSPSTLTIPNASSGSSTVTVTPVGGFSGTVSFTCSVPSTLSNTTCSIPGTVTQTGSATVTISNATAASASFWKRDFPPGNNSAFLFGMLALGITSAILATRKHPRAPLGALALFSLALMTGCGGGNSSSSSSSSVSGSQGASVTGTVTITATSSATSLANSITKTITISVTEP
jgi:subtilase family serine protease